ncbi:MAG: Uma2 family endonuclease [Nitrospiraceae bacterium]
MSPQAHRIKLTYGDYLSFPEDGKRHELIDGDHYVTPSPNTKHQTVSSNLHRILAGFAHDKKLGRIFAAPYDVVQSESDVLQPDLVFVSSSRSSIITESNIQGAPDLVIEILSDSTRRTDEIVKRKRYEAFGVQQYWVVDPVLDSVKVYRMSDRGYTRVAELTKEETESLTTPFLPSLSIAIADIFA